MERLRAARAAVKAEKAGVAKAVETLTATKEAQALAQEAARLVQTKAVDHFSGVVNRCLQAVFDRPLGFKLLLEKKRGRTEARPAFYDGDKEVPRQFVAGGVKDVAAFALRLAKLRLERPKKRQLLVLDEPLKHLNGNSEQERFAALLADLSKEFGVQIVLVTDDEFLKIGKVIEL